MSGSPSPKVPTPQCLLDFHERALETTGPCPFPVTVAQTALHAADVPAHVSVDEAFAHLVSRTYLQLRSYRGKTYRQEMPDVSQFEQVSEVRGLPALL